jgi:catechol 2,3-dioxygenase-like lactoylglutathione lyase family enzyme
VVRIRIYLDVVAAQCISAFGGRAQERKVLDDALDGVRAGTEIRTDDATGGASVGKVDLKLEAVVIPVSDVDRAKRFYDSLGWRLDADFGADVSEVFHAEAPGAQFQPDGTSGRVGGPANDRASYSSFCTFNDPDGNGWLLQEITTRLPGRIDADTTSYSSVNDVEQALVRAATAHGEHEKRIGQADENWPAWYARYMVAEQSGAELPL